MGNQEDLIRFGLMIYLKQEVPKNHPGYKKYGDKKGKKRKEKQEFQRNWFLYQTKVT